MARYHANIYLHMIGTIIHPKATIFAIAGPIIIGSGCIIEEAVIIVNRLVTQSLFLLRQLHLIELVGRRN